MVLHILQELDFLFKEANEDEKKRRYEELFRIGEKAMRLSGILSLQNRHIEYRFLDDLNDTTFHFPDPGFRTHRLLKLEEDDDDEDAEDVRRQVALLDGQPLDLIVTPSIVRHGDPKVGRFEEEIIVFQGISWIVKDKILTGKKQAAPEDASDIGTKCDFRENPPSVSDGTGKMKPCDEKSSPSGPPRVTGKQEKATRQHASPTQHEPLIHIPRGEEMKIFSQKESKDVMPKAMARPEMSTAEEIVGAAPMTGSDCPQSTSATSPGVSKHDLLKVKPSIGASMSAPEVWNVAKIRDQQLSTIESSVKAEELRLRSPQSRLPAPGSTHEASKEQVSPVEGASKKRPGSVVDLTTDSEECGNTLTEPQSKKQVCPSKFAPTPWSYYIVCLTPGSEKSAVRRSNL